MIAKTYEIKMENSSYEKVSLANKMLDIFTVIF